MPKSLVLFVSILLLFSCQQETEATGGTNKTEVADLENKVSQLEMDNAMKDSVINEALAFFNEIKTNLESIGVRKDQIRVLSEDPELADEDKQWILEEIRHINFLREDNARKVRQLNEDLKKNGLKIKELEVMVESLVQEIKWKDEQIAMLENELSQMDQQYAKLFDAYQEQAIMVDNLTDQLNSVYYAYGSEKELLENNIVEKKNGFLGMGKTRKLKEQFNEDYFTELNSSKAKSITIEGVSVHLITDHPSSSYELEESGARTFIKIKDASEFWKISKYLVVIVD